MTPDPNSTATATPTPTPKPPSQFEQTAGDNPSLLMEVYGFLGANKKWWLLPIVISLSLIAVLVLLSTSAAAPFIYTLF